MTDNRNIMASLVSENTVNTFCVLIPALLGFRSVNETALKYISNASLKTVRTKKLNYVYFNKQYEALEGVKVKVYLGRGV